MANFDKPDADSAVGHHTREPARSVFPKWIWFVAAAVLLLSAYLSFRTGRLRAELERKNLQLEAQRRTAEQLKAERALREQVQAIVLASDTRDVTLRPANASGALPSLKAYWNEARGLALIATKVPVPPSGRTYRLWVLPKQGDPAGVHSFAPAADGSVLMVLPLGAAMKNARALALTEEPAAGGTFPSTQPLWVRALP